MTGQITNDSLIISFYNKTLDFYFSDTNFVSPQKIGQHILVQTVFNVRYLKKKVATHNFKFYDTDFKKYLDKPIEKNVGRHLYALRHAEHTEGTVDVFLDEWVIYGIDKNNPVVEESYKGRSEETPVARFLYKAQTNSWEFVPLLVASLKK